MAWRPLLITDSDSWNVVGDDLLAIGEVKDDHLGVQDAINGQRRHGQNVERFGKFLDVYLGFDLTRL